MVDLREDLLRMQRPALRFPHLGLAVEEQPEQRRLAKNGQEDDQQTFADYREVLEHRGDRSSRQETRGGWLLGASEVRGGGKRMDNQTGRQETRRRAEERRQRGLIHAKRPPAKSSSSSSSPAHIPPSSSMNERRNLGMKVEYKQ